MWNPTPEEPRDTLGGGLLAVPAGCSRPAAPSRRRGRASPLEPRARAGLDRATMDVVRRRQVLDRDAQRLVDRDVVGGPPPGHASQEHVPQLAEQVIVGDRTLVARQQEVTRFRQAGLAAV